MKNVYCPPPGMLLCATDYSFIELVMFAESCVQRFGFSVMADVINAGIDPHRWFAGVMNKVIDTDLRHKDDPKWVAELNAFLKEQIDSDTRGKAKAADFGFPGGMSAKRFFEQCRSTGIKVTLEEADFMRRSWIETFKEMALHTKVQEWYDPRKSILVDYGGEEDDENDGDDRRRYQATTITGMHRVRCSYNAAMNFQFQGPTAQGAKEALWALYRAGYGDRMLQFVHDEVIYGLYPEELRTRIPEVERLMLEGMHTIVKHVKVGCESSVMRHWDKKAVEFSELEWDSEGNPIVAEPAFIQELMTQKAR